MKRGRPLQTAIVGMGCHFPGARNLTTYWENILAGKDCTRDVPPDRWDPRIFCDPASSAADRVPSSRGGYLDSPLRFDAAAHGIMPRTVEGGEPEQFLVLEAAMAALEDAGQTISDLADQRVEVVIGRGNYFNRGNLTRLQHGRMIAQTLSLLAAFHPDWSQAELDAIRDDLRKSLPPFEAATIPGQLTNATAGRLAHRLNLRGASYVVDAASASSLVAVDMAARALQERRADLAIAAGVYLEADVDFPLVFRQLGAVSKSGSSRPFTADADGMLSGEGVGVVILKRLSDAEWDDDRIYAVIQGIGLASDGKSAGLAAPSASGHARAIKAAYRRSGIDPASVMLIEGHGLGVPAADRAELLALNAIFPPRRHGHRTLGAVSSMIGHAMPAAGMAGLIKSALALHHRILPPTLHTEKPHPLLMKPGSAFGLGTIARPWIHADPDTPRRAGVNAFGFAGINTHAVLEEHVDSADAELPGALEHWETEAILLSAPDRPGLVERAKKLVGWLERRAGAELKDVAYTLNCISDDPPGPERLGLVASSVADLIARFRSLLPRLGDRSCRTIRDGRGAYYWEQPLLRGKSGGLAFLFPGEGSQYPGMLADLCFHFPEVRRLFDTGDRIALELGETVPPSEHLFGRGTEGGEALWVAATGVNAVLSAQWALYQVLTRLGLRPDAVAGHSSGEVLALAAAGVFQVDRELENQLGRLGNIFQGLESSGDVPEARLLAAACSRERIESLCRDLGLPAIEIAMDNCPHQVVVAGEPREVDRVAERLRQEGILWEALPFSRAYHTSNFAVVLAPFAEFFAQLTFRPSSVPIYSCASRQAMPSDPEEIRALAVAQWTRTVAFRETIETMHADGLRLFVDVGSRGNLAGFAEDILRGKPAFAIAANLPRRAGPTQLNHLVAATFAQGASLRADYLYARRRPRPIDWNVAEGPPRATVELKIGFPEMKVCDELLSRFSFRPQAAAADPPLRESPVPGSAIPLGLHCHPVKPTVMTNGFVHRDEDLAPCMSTLAYSEERLTMLEPHSPSDIDSADVDRRLQVEERLENLNYGMPDFAVPNGESEVGSDAWSDRDHDEEPDAAPESTGAEEAMVSFQETMRAFLRTQQEVLNAYLVQPAWETGESVASAGSLAADPSPCEVIGESVEEPDHYPVERGEFARTDDHVAGSALPGAWFDGSPAAALHSAETAEPLRSGPLPGPWAGQVRRLAPGAEIETVFVLDRRDDPIAEHHTLGGRKVSALDPSLRGLPVLPFAVMAEMTAQVAALIVSPGLVLTTLVQVRAHKWIRYEDGPSQLEIRGRHVSGSGDERVWVGIFNRGPGGENEAARPVFEATAVFGPTVPEAPLAAAWSLVRPEVSRFTAESLYREQWLFHGPAFQALVEVGKFSEEGIDGTLRVLPFEPLVRQGQRVALHTDVIIIDSFTHLLGCWGLDYLKEGDIVYPLRLEALELCGNRPPVGTDVACRISVEEIQRHRVRVLVEIVRPDGTLWIRIRDWEDWRFHWPARYRDVFRAPDAIFVGEEIALVDPRHGPVSQAKCVWLEPPADMGRPVWRDVLEQIQLGPEERSTFLASCGPDRRRSHRLWGRIAAKEAARRLWRDEGLPPTYPADLAIRANRAGQPYLKHAGHCEDRPLPAISIAHADGVAVALAVRDPSALVGIDVEPVTNRPTGFEESAFTAAEQTVLGRWSGANRAEWVARFWCAKEAAGKAAGVGLAAGPSSAEVVEIDEESAEMHVRLSPELLAACPHQIASVVRIVSARRGNYVWAWTIREGADS
jgi:acyl transferase domain-containing protein/phosphopantetheinyl transferase